MKTDFKVRIIVQYRAILGCLSFLIVLQLTWNCIQQRQPAVCAGWHISTVARRKPSIGVRSCQVRSALSDITVEVQQLIHSSVTSLTHFLSHIAVT